MIEGLDSHIAMLFRLSSWSSCLLLPNAGIPGMCHRAHCLEFIFEILKQCLTPGMAGLHGYAFFYWLDPQSRASHFVLFVSRTTGLSQWSWWCCLAGKSLFVEDLNSITGSHIKEETEQTPQSCLLIATCSRVCMYTCTCVQ